MYVILFLMGISPALVENLGANLLVIVQYTLTFSVVVLGCNLAGLFYTAKISVAGSGSQTAKPPSRLHMVLESLQLCGVLLVGFATGYSAGRFSPLPAPPVNTH